MPNYIVDLWLDGYESEQEMEDACNEFIYDQLNMTASSVRIKKIDDVDIDKLVKVMNGELYNSEKNGHLLLSEVSKLAIKAILNELKGKGE
jgi:hypothetical protein